MLARWFLTTNLRVDTTVTSCANQQIVYDKDKRKLVLIDKTKDQVEKINQPEEEKPEEEKPEEEKPEEEKKE